MSNDVEIAIVGAGFGGLGMAAILRREGRDDFVILERADRVGGTWRDNTYPGCGCDVPSHLYWYSFDDRPDWSRHYSLQPEIQENIEKFARRHDLLRHIRFGTEIIAATWHDDTGRWEIKTQAGDRLSARILITATGQLSEPSFRGIAGRETFEGPSFHSAQWRDGADLAGKRVAVIGNGASAIQLIPEVARIARELTVFQRSAAYVVPRGDRAYSAEERRIFQEDDARFQESREAIFRDYEGRYASLILGSDVARDVAALARQHLEEQIGDPVLRERLWPDYEVGCKRVLISDDFYPVMARPNVSLVTDRIERVEKNGIRTADGTLHEADVIVYATGFDSTRFLGHLAVTGRKGTSLREEAWRDGAEAYLGMTVSGFPNLFILYGPNTNLNHNSIIAMLEAQYGYVMQLLQVLAANPNTAIEVKAEIVALYNEQLDREQQRLAFISGCNSWYKNARGRVTNNWTGSVEDYWRRTATAELAEYDLLNAPQFAR